MPLRVHDKYFLPYIKEAEILARVRELAKNISSDFNGKQPLFLAVLNGAFMFASDLFKSLEIEAEISFIKLSSYAGTHSTGEVVTVIGLENNLADRHVIILEDIIDTGKTIAAFIPQLQIQGPASISLAVLLHKSEATLFPIKIDYLGFEVQNKFLLGYGLDYNGLGRNLRDLYQLDT
jgi:hypoxanthine phosphoribosyltransferase